jgi:hypothetical protein
VLRHPCTTPWRAPHAVFAPVGNAAADASRRGESPRPRSRFYPVLARPSASSEEAGACRRDTVAIAIRAVYQQRGEFAAAVELRRLFPGITDNAQARECARTIAGWKPLPLKELPKRPRLRRVV